ncbi:cytochrome o ubiquinol oxidase subunit IV [Scleromatobacter humisilvae]|uniref:Cytochrome bo(3) ubiquinol oxidase subunit 4 n=1 Tax=Scleromatobacter humisilvae TaxID=2897159 RepID=A0A9X1YKJ9_9BURK|nr:cytochrome o ubiquinol oxidase subunit IV [Scleromatobacter humisilvae]MCK9687135.1 cytochrome o ubiquinol oxidase subunit IV [Scleromatobacter humisilvae]
MTQVPTASLETARVTPGTENGQQHGSLQGYLVGYAAAAVLTIAAFAAARTAALTPASAIAAITVLAIGQMLVHLIFFLHISTTPNQRTNILAFAITMLIVVLIVGGSLWIMSHLQSNMMPTSQLMRMQR